MPSLRVHNISFQCDLPYTEGYALTTAEAGALNRLRSNAVSELARKAIAKARGANAPDPTPEELEALAQAFAFVGPAFAPPLDPQAIEATRIAQALVREQLTRTGQAERDLPPGKFGQLVRDVALTPSVRTEANRRVLATQAVATSALLGDILDERPPIAQPDLAK